MSCWSANPISAPTGSGGSTTNFAPANAALGDRIDALLAPLGIVRGSDRANAGADLGAWANAGIAAVDLNQDGTRYFDYHHTPGRHARQGRSGAAPAECRGLDGGAGGGRERAGADRAGGERRAAD